MNNYELKEYKYQIRRTLLPLREELWRLIDERNSPVERIDLDDGCFRIRIGLSADFFIEIALEYTHRENLQFFFHFCQWVSFDDNKPQAEDIPLKKKLVPGPVQLLGKYKNGKYLLTLTNTFPTEVCELINKLIPYKDDLLKACEESTNYNPDGTHKKVFKSWKSKAIITKVYKSQGIVRSVQGISKTRQNFFDKLPTLHGSNGSYVENAPINGLWI